MTLLKTMNIFHCIQKINPYILLYGPLFDLVSFPDSLFYFRYTLKAAGQGAGTFNIGPSSGIVKLAKVPLIFYLFTYFKT